MITLDNVTVKSSETKLLNGVSLRVAPGEHVVIGGKTGAGKSTLILTILGFHVPTSGSVVVDGIEMSSRTVRRIRRSIAYVDQEPVLRPVKTIDALRAPFRFAANRHQMPTQGEIETMLESVGLEQSVLEKETSILSGGEKQRVCIARALLLQRSVLILDEISSALDEQTSGELLEHIRAQPVTVLAVSHNPSWLNGFDRAITLDHAQVVSQ